jgi:hypothetical protein
MQIFFFRKKTLPVHARCRNCGTQMEGRYCHNCGQDVFAAVTRSFKDLVYTAFENIFVLDNKLFVSLKYLFFYPGKLTKEFIDGKIVRYVHPAKFFWFASILFFALFIGQIDFDEIKERKEKNETETVASLADLDDELDEDTPQIIKDEVEEFKQNPEKYKYKFFNNLENIFSTYAPYVAFLLIPFYAFLLFLFYRKTNPYYIDHLIFTLHFHTFVFLLLSIHFGITALFPDLYSDSWVFVYLPLLYLTIASYVFYRPKITSLIWKTGMINIIYFIGLIVLFILIIYIIAIILVNKTN